VLLAACSDEFSTEPVDVTVDNSPSGTRTVTVHDTITLEARFLVSGQRLTGVTVRWASSDSARLALKPMTGRAGSGDTLLAETQIQAIAHARGPVVVTATVEQAGLEPASVEHNIKIMERWKTVTAGGGYTCGLTAEYDAYCWGSRFIGTEKSGLGLGSGSAGGSRKPVPVLGGLKFRALSAGDLQTCGLTLDTGQLYCWGRNLWGELGDGSFDDALVPRLAVGGHNFAQISTSSGLTCGVTATDFSQGQDNSVFPHNTLCWGRSSLGGLGHGGRFLDSIFSVPCGLERSVIFLCLPRLRTGVTQAGQGTFRLHSVSVGNGFACGIANEVSGGQEGEALCWGPHDAQQLGQADSLGGAGLTSCIDTLDVTSFKTIQCTFNPLRAAQGFIFSALSSGGPDTCGVSDAQVYCWGGSYEGSPRKINTPPGAQIEIESISVGGGRIGVRGSAEPFSAGDERPLACALAAGGQVFCWGDNVNGELGSGEIPGPGNPIDHRDQMQKVDQDTLVFIDVSAGSRLATPAGVEHDAAHACALTQDRAIYCWGSNLSGALGVLDSSPAFAPIRIVEPDP